MLVALGNRMKAAKKPTVSISPNALRGLDRLVDTVCRVVPILRRRPVAKSA